MAFNKKFARKKTYGEYKTVRCPFCDRLATQKNEQGIEVCHKHVKEAVEEIKCTCGSWLEPKAGKFGRYFNCVNCGNMNYEKAMGIKAMTMKNQPNVEKPAPKVENKPSQVKKKPYYYRRDDEEKKETVITSRDLEYFD